MRNVYAGNWNRPSGDGGREVTTSASSGSATRQLASFAASVKFSDLPADDQMRTKLRLLNVAGSVLAARRLAARGPGHDGFGIIAASKNWLSDCDGDFYFASLHTGATAWLVLASLHENPFFLIR